MSSRRPALVETPDDLLSAQSWKTGCCDFCTRCDDAWCFCLVATAFPCVGFGMLLEQAKLVDSCAGPALFQCCIWSLAGAAASGGTACLQAVAGVLYLVPVCQRFALRHSLVLSRRYDEKAWVTALCEVCCAPCSMTQIRDDMLARKYVLQPAYAPARLAHFAGWITAEDQLAAPPPLVNSMAPHGPW